jgi:hypothetical protein
VCIARRAFDDDLNREPNQRETKDEVPVKSSHARIRTHCVARRLRGESKGNEQRCAEFASLAAIVGTSLSGPRVVRELDAVITWRGTPNLTLSDQRTELSQTRCSISIRARMRASGSLKRHDHYSCSIANLGILSNVQLRRSSY